MKIYINSKAEFNEEIVKSYISKLREMPESDHIKGVLASKKDRETMGYCAGGVGLLCGGYTPKENGYFDLRSPSGDIIGWKNAVNGLPMSDIFSLSPGPYCYYYSVVHLNDRLGFTFNQIADCYQALLDGKTEVEI